MISRRTFLVSTAGGALALYLAGAGERPALARTLPHQSLAAGSLSQFAVELPRPAVMPRLDRFATPQGNVDYYEVGVRQFQQQMLPPGMPKTTVWGYGPAGGPTSAFSTPSATIEAKAGVPVRVKWVNQLVDDAGKPLSHLLPVDPTLHWANVDLRPNHMGVKTTDSHPDFTGLTYVPPSQFTDPTTQYTAYQGPVPMVTHLHGAVGVGDESDGYPEAWVVPAGTAPAGYASHGTWWEFFAAKFKAKYGVDWAPGTQMSQYPNLNRATTLWMHDHAMGMTRVNVYAGPVGFYIVRDEEPRESKKKDGSIDAPVGLPGASTTNSTGSKPYEISIAIQDRSFNADGSLFYPDTRAFFDGYAGPYVPETPVPPIWNPEFFGNTLLVNGVTWPFATLEKRRYRLRLLNGCGSRVLILAFGGIPGAEVWQIGNDGGYLPKPVNLAGQGGYLTLAPAERADIVLDLTKTPVGRYVLPNVGPDSPYGGDPVGSFEPADPSTTGRVMQLRVVAAKGTDQSLPGSQIQLPAIPPLPAPVTRRRVALFEHLHTYTGGEGPVMAMLGELVEENGLLVGHPSSWMAPITENPNPGDTELWEIFNFTADAHPVHVHETTFEVVDRQEFTLTDGVLSLGATTAPLPGEAGRKDTVIAAPGQVTRIRATFTQAGQYVWHCHILEHEDNEMMRPFRIGPVQPGQPMSMGGGTH